MNTAGCRQDQALSRQNEPPPLSLFEVAIAKLLAEQALSVALGLFAVLERVVTSNIRYSHEFNNPVPIQRCFVPTSFWLLNGK